MYNMASLGIDAERAAYLEDQATGVTYTPSPGYGPTGLPLTDADRVAAAIAAAGAAAPGIAQTVLSFRKPIQIQCPGTGKLVFISQGSTQEQIKAACGEAAGAGVFGSSNLGSLLLVGGVVIGVGILAYAIFKKR